MKRLIFGSKSSPPVLGGVAEPTVGALSRPGGKWLLPSPPLKVRGGWEGLCLALFLLFCIVMVSLSNHAFAGTVQLPQSGQTQCYDVNGNVIACAGTGQDGAKRTGAAWPNPRFVASGDCVTDNLTGLLWVKSPDSITRTWADAITYANNMTLCGYSDWRLPNINELRSLVHSGYNEETCGGTACQYMSDWLNSKGFTNVQSGHYWSSSTYAGDTYSAWIVVMWVGYVGYYDKTDYGYVWPVRGGQ